LKKVLTILLAAALITAFSVPVFAATSTTSAPSKVTVTKMTMKAHVKGLSVSIKYPKVSGLKDKTVQKKINSSLYKSAKTSLNEGKKNVASLKKEGIKDTNCNTMFSYKVTYNKNGLLSVVMDNYQYAGGAHGDTIKSSKTFNLQTGATIKLKSLFSDNTSAYKLINASVRSQIDAKEKAGDFGEITKFKAISSNQDYYLYDNGIKVYFQEYDYFPYACGIPSFKITFNELQPYMAGAYSLLNPKLTKLSTTAATTLKAGQYGYIVEDANATTGYEWNAVSDNTKVATVTQYYVQDYNPNGLDGVGGKEIIIVKGESAGSASITCTYARSFDTSDAVSQVYKVTVE